MFVNFTDKSEEMKQIAILKENELYRIDTSQERHWSIRSNTIIRKGQALDYSSGDYYDLNLRGTASIEITLKETAEKKRVYMAVHAVPGDSSCEQVILEIPWCFMNHACKPNIRGLYIQDREGKNTFVGSVATRDIKIGDELTYDYATEQYAYAAPFQCTCNDISCRGLVKGFSGLSSKEKQRLWDYCSPHVQKKHNSMSKTIEDEN